MRLYWDRERMKFVPPEEMPRREVARSDLSAPMIQTDGMDLLLHPATGLRTDSKAAFRKMTRDSGCIEVGDEAPTTPKTPDFKVSKKDRVEAIKAAVREHGGDVL